MEKAIYNGKIIIASDIIEDVNLELEIKTASKNGKLLCPDENCTNPQLKYCHGEKYMEYFAHVNNCGCSYEKYDKNNTTQIRHVQKILYTHFKKSGYNVQIDQKIFSNHYAHLFYEPNKIAIEIITQRKSAPEIDRLQNLYDSNNINVCWVFIGELNNNKTEKSMMFGKRFPVNFAKHNSCIVINPENNNIEQYRLDTQEYKYNNQPIFINGFNELYKEQSTIDNLKIETDTITLNNYNIRFQEWLNKKNIAYNEKIKSLQNHTVNLQHNNISKPYEYIKLSYEEALYNELTEADKQKYDSMKLLLNNYQHFKFLFLEGSLPKEIRDEIASKYKRNLYDN